MAEVIAEGKTKTLYLISDTDGVIVQNKNKITADNDPSKTKEFSTKAKCSNFTNAHVMQLLKNAGIPVAFKGVVSKTAFISERCDMIMLEIVGRRYVTGSYLKRYPQYKITSGLHRFEQVVCELFLKTTNGKLISKDNKILVNGLTNEQDDPLIQIGFEEWELYHPKKENESLKIFIDHTKVLPSGVTVNQIELLLTQVFRTLEKAFAKINLRLIDVKIELGVNKEGQLVVADVIDNDSWRLMTQRWVELSKQRFRDGDDVNSVKKHYEKVVKLTSIFPILNTDMIGLKSLKWNSGIWVSKQ